MHPILPLVIQLQKLQEHDVDMLLKTSDAYGINDKEISLAAASPTDTSCTVLEEDNDAVIPECLRKFLRIFIIQFMIH
jgi:hypothetical protein